MQEQAPGHVLTLLEEAGRTYGEITRFALRITQRIRRVFPLMSQLLDRADTFTFRDSGELRLLLAWQSSKGAPFGWICNAYSMNRPVPTEVLPEHRLLHKTIGALESRVGTPANLPMGDVSLFAIPESAGLRGKAEAYETTAAWLGCERLPDAELFIVFGAESNGDLWVYTPEDKKAFQIVFGVGPLDSADVLRQVTECPVLYQVQGAETFRGLVEFFAERHLEKLMKPR